MKQIFKSTQLILFIILISVTTKYVKGQAPTITSFTPNSGSIGTLVTISGTNLTTSTSITIGGVNAINISSTSTSLTALVMPGTPTGLISVTNSLGFSLSNNIFTIKPSFAPNIQQGDKLFGAGSIPQYGYYVRQGISVSLSADGNTALVGGYIDDNQKGAAWVYTRSGGVWAQQGNKLIGTGSVSPVGQGYSVSLSADGNTALIGSAWGGAWIFIRNNSTWTQQGNKLLGTGIIGAASFGEKVSLSADGNTAIIGGRYDNNDQGAAWIFIRNGSNWTQQGNKLVGTGGIGTAIDFGSSVSISADGNTAIIGGEYDNNALGAAWIFTRNGNVWSQQGNKLVGTGFNGNNNMVFQGSAVSLSADGNTCIVGGRNDNNGVGAAWIFTRIGNVWTQQGNKLVGSGFNYYPNQGSAVSLSADGNTAIISGNDDSGGQGASWIFIRNGGIWTQQGNKLVGSGNIGQAYQGGSVCLSADGNTCIIGGIGDNRELGAVWIYSSITINSSSDLNGIINPSGVNPLKDNKCQTYTFTPNPGYWIDSVIVNGVQVPTASSYTFNNVTSDQSIRVTYRSLAAALAAANICSNDTLVSTVNLPAQSNVRATTYYSNIYLFNQNNTGNAFKYNVNDRKYTAIADKPTACIECGVAEANGKVYCFNTNGTTEAYDIATNTWQNQTNQTSTSTSSVYAASINNKIYVLGYNNNQNTFYQYNPQTNSYTALTNPTTSSSQSRLVAYNNKLYKIGGTDNNSQPISSVEVYNPTNNTWTSMPDLPVALTQVGATHYDNKLYVFGGKQANNTNSNKVYVFDFTSNAWYAESNTQNTNRTHIEAKTANNMVFLFGGTDTSNIQTNQAQRYFCKDQLCDCKWAEYVCNGVSQNEPCPIPTSSLYRPGTVFCNGIATKVVEVTNPITGKIWMDRNLGASRTAVSSTDTLAYGDLYQWGRAADGHQCRNSGTTTKLSTTDQPGHDNFILAPNSPNDWRSPKNSNLWQGVNGFNNPCPFGYRIPTNAELDLERTSWLQNNSLGAFNSPLKLTLSGSRIFADGVLGGLSSYGVYWSNMVFGIDGIVSLYFFSGTSFTSSHSRAYGLSVRCIKD